MEHRTGIEQPDLGTARHQEDLALARAILGGSDEAWQTFLCRYSRLIAAVIRRYAPSSLREEAGFLEADVLQSLYGGGLARYEGRASLSTWLVAVTRGAVVDDVRRRLGGRLLKRRLRSLGPYEREVFRLYYLHGLSFGMVLDMALDQGARPTPDRLLMALHEIEERVTDRLAQRLRYDLHAQSVGAASGRLLEYLDHLRTEAEASAGGQSPEYHLMEREARRTVEGVLAAVACLPAEERRIMSLRFEQGWTARRIAQELGLSGQKKVYTIVERVLRGLRRAFEVAP
jgi:DNA-directed RNA polymerase specialized sigma24 family protein